MNHLCIVTDAWHPQVNGVVTTLDQMLLRGIKHGFRVTVIHPGMFKTVPAPSYPEIKLAWNLWTLGDLMPDDVDSVHIATEGPLGIAARLLCTKRGWRYTTGYHTNFPEYLDQRTGIPAPLFYPLFRLLHKSSRAILTPSARTVDKLKFFMHLPQAMVWGRGFDENVFKPAVPPHTRGGDGLALLYVGRVSIEKNLEALLTLSEDDTYHINIVGDGPDRERLEKKYPKVSFHGYKHGAELAEFYQAADVFVFPSKTDTFGIVMVEAMACGTPVAAYPVEGPTEAVLPGVGGVLNDNLLVAIHEAAKLDRHRVPLNAGLHNWEHSASTFFEALVDTTGCQFTPYYNVLA